MDSPTLREAVSNAIHYWEPRRLLYNALLAAIVVFYFVYALKTNPALKASLSFDGFLGLVLLAVLANVAYCAAYVADVFAQWSSYRDLWIRYHWVLLLVGMVFAGILTRFFSIAMFSPCCG